MNTQELLSRLQRHYIKPGEVLPGGMFLTEIQTPGSVFPRRRVDALYMGFTRSRGNLLDGHELKVSRSDWLHELDQAHKAEWWFCHTDRWWLVVPDLTVAKEDELPPGWGLMIPNARTKTRMDIVVKAEPRHADIDRELLFELAKKQDTVRADCILSERRDRNRLVAEGVTAELDRRRSAAPKTLNETARETLDQLQALTGLHLEGASYGKDLAWVDTEAAAKLMKRWFQSQVNLDTFRARTRRDMDTIKKLADQLAAVLDGEG